MLENLTAKIRASIQSLDWESATAFSNGVVDELMRAGGPVTLALAILAVITALIILLKSVQLALARTGGRRFGQRVIVQWHRGPHAIALKMLARKRGPIARTLSAAMHGLAQSHVPAAQVREEANRVARIELARLRADLTLLKVIAIAAPMVGILGLLFGWMDTLGQFQQANATATASEFYGALRKSLVPPAIGIGVALFAVVFYYWLSSRIDRCNLFIDDLLSQLFGGGPSGGGDRQFKPLAELEEAAELRARLQAPLS